MEQLGFGLRLSVGEAPRQSSVHSLAPVRATRSCSEDGRERASSVTEDPRQRGRTSGWGTPKRVGAFRHLVRQWM